MNYSVRSLKGVDIHVDPELIYIINIFGHKTISLSDIEKHTSRN